jgi:AGZA family xanthine/uracil permease-like MFS transporter
VTTTPTTPSTLNRLFALERHRTTPRIEITGGVTTFVTMAYIIVVNPAILAFAGLPIGPSTVATILAAMFGSLLMGFYANRPIAVAPYMGENAFVAFGLTAMGIAWPQALGAVFVSGVLFLLLTLTGIRVWMAGAISTSMKHSFVAGIGLFMALIGLYEAGIVTSFVTGLPAQALVSEGTGVLRSPDVPLKLGNLHDPRVLLAVFGFLLITALQHRRIRGAILLGMALTAVLGIALGFATAPTRIAALPFTGDYTLALAFGLDIPGVLTLSFFPVLLTLFLMGFLDTLGTLVALGATGDFLDGRGNLPEIERPMLVDAVSCMFSGLVGTTTTGAYIESATGIREGARTGLAAVTTAALFGVSLFFIPLLEPLQRMRFAYAPALIAVGLSMMSSFRLIDFEDLTEGAPAFATVLMMVFTYNIANGLTAGLALYPLAKIAAGRGRELRASSVVLAGLCAVYYAFGLPH